jgi:hypothetical protein
MIMSGTWAPKHLRCCSGVLCRHKVRRSTFRVLCSAPPDHRLSRSHPLPRDLKRSLTPITCRRAE